MKATPRKEIVKKIVVDLAIDEDTVNDVLSFAFSRAYDAFKTGNSVEISGFGKFVFNESMAKKITSTHEKGITRLEKVKKEKEHLPKYVKYIDLLISQKKELYKDLNDRINDKLETYSGRVDQPSISSGEAEGTD